jgi:hypothetical protein
LSNKFPLLSTFDYCTILIPESHFELSVNSSPKGLNNLLVPVRVIIEKYIAIELFEIKVQNNGNIFS